MNPTYDFTGQVAFVTGASSGMGLATARAFADFRLTKLVPFTGLVVVFGRYASAEKSLWVEAVAARAARYDAYGTEYSKVVLEPRPPPVLVKSILTVIGLKIVVW